MLKITFYHTLYKEDVTMICGDIQFHYTDHAYVTFASMGSGYLVDAKHIKNITSIED